MAGETWIGNHGYRVVATGKPGGALEHRLVMEAHLGRLLGRFENVHHKNGNKLDNRITNLELVAHGEHVRLHHHGKPKKPDVRSRIVALREQGLRVGEIAGRVGLHQSTVSRHLRAAAGHPRPAWRRQVLSP